MMARKSKVPFGVAIVGCGNVSSGHISSWLHQPRRARIMGLYDPARKFCEERRKQYELGDVTIYDDYEQVLDDDRIAIVNLCSMSDMHDDQIAAALEAGKHIMTEKPTGYNLEGRRRMRWYARKYKHLKVGVAYSLRYYPINIKVRELVQKGIIGEPMWAHIEHHHGGHGSAPSSGPASRGIDRATDKGGRYIPGSDMVHATHPHDLARYMLGDPVEVYALRNACGVFANVTFENEAIAQVQAGSTSGKGLSHVTPVMILGT
jgi:predicted dehydrogenase